MLFWGVFPERLKYAIIKPLHKSDDRCGVSNYRPVSLLTSFTHGTVWFQSIVEDG